MNVYHLRLEEFDLIMISHINISSPYGNISWNCEDDWSLFLRNQCDCLGETTVILSNVFSLLQDGGVTFDKCTNLFSMCLSQNRFYRRWRWWWRDHSSEEDKEKDFKRKFWWKIKRQGKRQEVQIKRCPLLKWVTTIMSSNVTFSNTC